MAKAELAAALAAARGERDAAVAAAAKLAEERTLERWRADAVSSAAAARSELSRVRAEAEAEGAFLRRELEGAVARKAEAEGYLALRTHETSEQTSEQESRGGAGRGGGGGGEGGEAALATLVVAGVPISEREREAERGASVKQPRMALCRRRE